MMTQNLPKFVLCNGSDGAGIVPNDNKAKILHLNYLSITNYPQNVHVALPDFVRRVYYLPDRILDLLEIAAYVYAADRLMSRGARDLVEYHSWSRSFVFIIRVRDHDFWKQPIVRESLSAALQFMTGDRSYDFIFQPGHSTPPSSLFDSEEFKLNQENGLSIILFSGGLDSLAGTIECLEKSDDNVCLVSHQSQPGTKKTQKRLFEALNRYYPGRVALYSFGCNLHSIHAQEETQRSRAFLYTSIAIAIAYAYSQEFIFVYENGVTSINFSRRQDLANARASRTTHPKTIFLLQKLFNIINDKPIEIMLPFLWKTKAEIFQSIIENKHGELIPSSVSCSRTFQNLGQATHCGICFQCIDRRIAAYASGSEDLDESGIYSNDMIVNAIESGESKTSLVDYLRQAKNFALWNIDCFYKEMLSELSDLLDCLPDCKDEIEVIESIWNLCHRHGQQVQKALRRIREIHDDPYSDLTKDSLLYLVFAGREHLKDPIDRLIEAIINIVSIAIPQMFRKKPPDDENDLNIKLNALISTHRADISSEHPTVSFACARVIPDHMLIDTDLLIESKYIRSGTTPSKASDGIAADITKYPTDSYKLFLVYDPMHIIPNDLVFKRDFELKGRVTICILR
jgi:7-cyano-7-deazaguanine synthase in queuosine biosynthesis